MASQHDKHGHSKAPARVTLVSGAPLASKLNSLLANRNGHNLLADVPLIEENAHFNRERIPDRPVHAKGGAAFGEFVVTNTSICRFSKAKLFAGVGKKTPVAVRFSQVARDTGYADSVRDFRGFAVKFKTDEGNWDMVGNNMPVFFVDDPSKFVSLVHVLKRDPETHLYSADNLWDFLSLMPESLHALLMLFGDRGIPDGWRHMHGYGVNTFQLVNEQNHCFYAKFHWITNQGVRNLEPARAAALAGSDPDYYLRDLREAIAAGRPPSWTLKFQVMPVPGHNSPEEHYALDVTRTWPHDKYPLIEVGKMTLNKNPDNYFAQVEQLAFGPANLVPGIQASPDKMLIGRMFAYHDAARYRLGANFADLPANRPVCPVFAPTIRDGFFTTQFQDKSVPNYLPSNKLRDLQLEDKQLMELGRADSTGFTRHNEALDQPSHEQARELLTRVLDAPARKRLVHNLANHLNLVKSREIRNKALTMLKKFDASFGNAIEMEMARIQ